MKYIIAILKSVIAPIMLLLVVLVGAVTALVSMGIEIVVVTQIMEISKLPESLQMLKPLISVIPYLVVLTFEIFKVSCTYVNSSLEKQGNEPRIQKHTRSEYDAPN